LAGLTLQQRQALLAQQRFVMTSDARRMLVRPPTTGIILPPGRVLLTSNGPASLMPGVTGRPVGVATATVTTSSGVVLTLPPTAVTHRPEKRKYDALRSDCHTNMLCAVFTIIMNRRLNCHRLTYLKSSGSILFCLVHSNTNNSTNSHEDDHGAVFMTVSLQEFIQLI